MSYDLIHTACVIRYPYLWAREAQHGETEGRKERPVAVGVRMARPDGDLVLFFPITTKQPEASRLAVEVPAIHSILRPIRRFSKAFFLPLLREFIARRKSATEVSRFR